MYWCSHVMWELISKLLIRASSQSLQFRRVFFNHPNLDTSFLRLFFRCNNNAGKLWNQLIKSHRGMPSGDSFQSSWWAGFHGALHFALHSLKKRRISAWLEYEYGTQKLLFTTKTKLFEHFGELTYIALLPGEKNHCHRHDFNHIYFTID